MKNYYLILEIDRDASQEEIKSAYLDLVKIYHPDRLGNISKERRRKIENKLKEINEAYETLSDLLSKAEYDNWLDYNLEEKENTNSDSFGLKDYYEILGVAQYANFDEIKNAYFQLIQFYNLDNLRDCTIEERHTFEAKLRDIKEAYQVLSDPANKSKYDSEYSSRGYGEAETLQPKPLKKDKKISIPKGPKIKLW